MKQILIFSLKALVCMTFALVCALLAEQVTEYHYAGLTGFFLGGILAASVTGLFD